MNSICYWNSNQRRYAIIMWIFSVFHNITGKSKPWAFSFISIIAAEIMSSCYSVDSIMVHLLHLPTRQTLWLSVTCHLLTSYSRGKDHGRSELLIQPSGNLCEHAWIRQELSQEHCVKIHFLCDTERDIDPSIIQQHCRHCSESHYTALSLSLSLTLKYSHKECTHIIQNSLSDPCRT